MGLEPTTLRLRVSCSTDWASREYVGLSENKEVICVETFYVRHQCLCWTYQFVCHVINRRGKEQLHCMSTRISETFKVVKLKLVTIIALLWSGLFASGWSTWADAGFQVREGGALKKMAPSGGRREQFWGIPCEKSRFHAKNHIFFNCRGRRENFWGISCEKSRFLGK